MSEADWAGDAERRGAATQAMKGQHHENTQEK